MTKPFTSVAAMMLAEEGKLLIADPVARYMPEFAELKVAVDSDNPTAKKLATEPLRRANDRAGSAAPYVRLDLCASRPARCSSRPTRPPSVGDEKQTNAEMAAKLAKVPLAYQPGTTFQYGMSTDVLGRVVEVASGMDLDRFIVERICKPLGLIDTGFGPIDGIARGPAAGRSRLRQAAADARTSVRSELDFRRQRLLSTARRLCALLPDAAQRRRTRRHATAFADRPSR